MKFLSSVFSLFLIYLSLPALAIGNDVGNGGNVVACRDDHNTLKSIELLDFYEARILRGIEANFGGPSGSLDQSFNILLSRLNERNPTRAARYKEWYSTFFKDANLLAGIKLVEIPDSNHVAIPAGCKVEQIVNQRKPEFPEDKRYVVNKDLWDALDNNSKAGLIFHEFIYREGIARGLEESTGVRYLNSLIAANRYKDLNPRQYISIQEQILFSDTDIFGAKINLHSYDDIHVDGNNLLKITLREGSVAFLPLNKQTVEATSFFLNDTGLIVSFIPAKNTLLQSPGGSLIAQAGDQVNLKETGEVLRAVLAANTLFSLASNQTVLCRKGSSFEFDPTLERLNYCSVAIGQHLLGPDYDLTYSEPRYSSNEKTVFDSSGHYAMSDGIWYGRVLIKGKWINVQNVRFEENRAATLFLKNNQAFLIKGKSYIFTSSSRIVFDKDGSLLAGELASPNTFVIRGTRINIDKGYVKFSAEGNLLTGDLTSSTTWNLPGQRIDIGGTFKCSLLSDRRSAKEVEFYPSGSLKYAILNRDQDVIYEGNKIHVPRGSFVLLQENGKISFFGPHATCK
ncbi:MAG: hypothetical protein ACXVCP_05795 [Bdellovibrio sp.]